MKLESELRYAINAAAKISSNNSRHWESEKLRREAVVAFLKSYPKKRMRVNKLSLDLHNAEKRVNECEQKLDKEFGLCSNDEGGHRILCDERFVKAGGKLPETTGFTAEQVVKEYAAAANAAEATAVLKKYGIVWK